MAPITNMNTAKAPMAIPAAVPVAITGPELELAEGLGLPPPTAVIRGTEGEAIFDLVSTIS